MKSIKLKLTIYFLSLRVQALEDANKDEFQLLLGMITSLKIMKLVSGQQILVDIITEQADLNSSAPIDPEFLDKLLLCSKYAIPHFSTYVCSNSYVSFYCSKLLPIIDSLVVEVPGCDLEIYQHLAEMIPSLHVTNESHPVNLAACQSIIFDKLKQYLSLPPPPSIEGIDKNGNSASGDNKEDDHSLQLTHVECLLYAFHQITKHKPDFLNSDEERLKDFKLRLQYLARGVQVYIKRLKDSLASVRIPPKKLNAPDDTNETEETKIKQIALKTTTNINTLIRDLFHIPPTFKSTIVPSWKPVAAGKGGVKKTEETVASKATVEPSTGNNDNSNTASKRKSIEGPASDPPKQQRTQRQPPIQRKKPQMAIRGGRRAFRGGRFYGPW